MPAVAWVTLVITALIIAAAALGLIRVIFHLKAVRQTLGDVIGGVAVVADRFELGVHRRQDLGDRTGPVRDFCETV
jgi:hypothetical protein